MSTIAIRAKFVIDSVAVYDTSEVIKMRAVGKDEGYPSDGSDENNTYAKFTPSASLEISVANPALMGKFAQGQKFYVDFTPAE